MLARSAASAVAVVPPLAVMKAGLYEVVEVRSSAPELYVPLVTPRGNPANVGVVVATIAVPVKGVGVAAWMCDAVVGLVRPENATLTSRRWSVVSMSISAAPVAGEVLGGDS